MKALALSLFAFVCLSQNLLAEEEATPADIVLKANETYQEAQGLCEAGSYSDGVRKYRQAENLFKDAAKAYKQAGDGQSAQDLKNRSKDLKNERKECKNMQQAEEAATRKKNYQEEKKARQSAADEATEITNASGTENSAGVIAEDED